MIAGRAEFVRPAVFSITIDTEAKDYLPHMYGGAMVYYPMTNGCSIDEFLRLVTVLQTSDANGVATPEGWQPGDMVIVPPPATAEAAEARINAGYECTDWYFCKKSL